MGLAVLLLIIVPVLLLIAMVLSLSLMKKGISGIKVMLLGINITLFAGIIAIDPDSNLGGMEYVIALFGLIISIIGLWKDDNKISN